MPHVPLEFEPPEDGEVRDLLQIARGDELVTVRWPLLSVTLVHAPGKYDWASPDIDDLIAKNPSFKAYDFYGFSVGQFTEVIVYPEMGTELTPAVLRVGGVECTLGEATPLAHYVLGGFHDSDVHGDWSDVWSIRLWEGSPH